MRGNAHPLMIPIGEVLDSALDNLFGDLVGALLVELNVLHTGEFRFGRGRDELRMEALREAAERGHDALHVHDHGVHDPRG
jgi:hypothetical protein